MKIKSRIVYPHLGIVDEVEEEILEYEEEEKEKEKENEKDNQF